MESKKVKKVEGDSLQVFEGNQESCAEDGTAVQIDRKNPLNPIPYKFRTLRVHPDSMIVALSNKESRVLDRIRYIKMNLSDQLGMLASQTELGGMTLGVTSAVQGEGKSTLSLNLAILLADGAKRVLIIDGDLRRPSLERKLGVLTDRGYASILKGQRPWSCCYHLGGTLLCGILSGSKPKNPGRLLDSAFLKECFDWARSNFDITIMDLPPILGLEDVHLVRRLLDGLILIVRAGQTPRSVFTEAVTQIPGKQIVGVILNGSTDKHSTVYYYYSHDENNPLEKKRRKT